MTVLTETDMSVPADHHALKLLGIESARHLPGTEAAPTCTLVIFGASGDLTKRLLMPALYNLAGDHLLHENLRIVGVDHADNSDEGWRASLTATMQAFTTDATAEFHTDHINHETWGWIRQRLSYLKGDFEQPDLYSDLVRTLSGNVVFYLAVAARFFGPIVDRLGAAGLLKQDGGNFRRVVIEKPFGSDLASARELNRRILKQADESQFFRIDHFLGKETVQSIMAIRFANALFEPVWRREYVDHVQITAAETIGVEARGAFYEPTGALRDMAPNHMFQLFCMTAMEPPNSFDAEAIRNEKVKLKCS
jgi:glucose-6-phosphate 1-dehydrogenase